MNRFFTLLLAAYCLTAVGQVPDYVPTDGLVAWYPFNGDAHDDSGNGNDGVSVSVESAFDRFGNENSAFYFSGSGCTPRVDIDMNTTEIVDAITISIWFNRQGNGCASPRLFEAKPPNGDQGLGHMIIAWGNGYAHPGQWNHNLNASSGTAYDVFLPADSVADIANDSWGMLVYRNDGLAASYFQNGVRIATMSNPENSTIHLPSDIAIGRMNHPAYDAFNGLIDDVGFWSRALSDQEILALYNAEVSVPGCTESEACNYAPEANVDDGSCELFTCKCLEGTVWSEELEGCVVANPSDSNFDGCVQLNDLLDLLSAYGDCAAEESAWQCGDPLEYQGDDYETVQIGEQCWFAENLRAENYRDGDSISQYSTDALWASSADGLIAEFGDGDAYCDAFWPNNACDEGISLDLYGRLYNGHSVADPRGLCPSGWKVPSDSNWQELELLGGMSVSDVGAWGHERGVIEQVGNQLKAASGWFGNNYFNENFPPPADSLGFRGLPGGMCLDSGSFVQAGDHGKWWTSTISTDYLQGNMIGRGIDRNAPGIARDAMNLNTGLSIRCIKDTE